MWVLMLVGPPFPPCFRLPPPWNEGFWFTWCPLQITRPFSALNFWDLRKSCNDCDRNGIFWAHLYSGILQSALPGKRQKLEFRLWGCSLTWSRRGRLAWMLMGRLCLHVSLKKDCLNRVCRHGYPWHLLSRVLGKEVSLRNHCGIGGVVFRSTPTRRPFESLQIGKECRE